MAVTCGKKERSSDWEGYKKLCGVLTMSFLTEWWLFRCLLCVNLSCIFGYFPVWNIPQLRKMFIIMKSNTKDMKAHYNDTKVSCDCHPSLSLLSQLWIQTGFNPSSALYWVTLSKYVPISSTIKLKRWYLLFSHCEDWKRNKVLRTQPSTKYSINK